MVDRTSWWAGERWKTALKTVKCCFFQWMGNYSCPWHLLLIIPIIFLDNRRIMTPNHKARLTISCSASHAPSDAAAVASSNWELDSSLWICSSPFFNPFLIKELFVLRLSSCTVKKKKKWKADEKKREATGYLQTRMLHRNKSRISLSKAINFPNKSIKCKKYICMI